MVGTKGTNRPAPDAATVFAVGIRLTREGHRFLSFDEHGRLTVRLDELAVLVTEMVTDYTDHVTAERDALAEDLAWELNATRPANGAAGGEAR